MDEAGSLRLAKALRNATRVAGAPFGSDVRTAYQLLARVLQRESGQQGFELAATHDADFHEVGPPCGTSRGGSGPAGVLAGLGGIVRRSVLPAGETDDKCQEGLGVTVVVTVVMATGSRPPGPGRAPRGLHRPQSLGGGSWSPQGQPCVCLMLLPLCPPSSHRPRACGAGVAFTASLSPQRGLSCLALCSVPGASGPSTRCSWWGSPAGVSGCTREPPAGPLADTLCPALETSPLPCPVLTPRRQPARPPAS